jgi:hypothetical protein
LVRNTEAKSQHYSRRQNRKDIQTNNFMRIRLQGTKNPARAYNQGKSSNGNPTSDFSEDTKVVENNYIAHIAGKRQKDTNSKVKLYNAVSLHK